MIKMKTITLVKAAWITDNRKNKRKTVKQSSTVLLNAYLKISGTVLSLVVSL